MKAKSIISILSTTALVAITIAGCADAGKGAAATKVEALDAAAWNQSKWISSAAPLVFPEENEDKAANGASWFLSTLKNEGKVERIGGTRGYWVVDRTR